MSFRSIPINEYTQTVNIAGSISSDAEIILNYNNYNLSEIVAGSDDIEKQFKSSHSCRTMTLSAGMKVVLWAANPVRPIEIPIIDDIGYVFFSFNCSLRGSARCVFQDGGERIQVAQEHCGTIQYGRDRRGVFHQFGLVRNLSVMMRPEQLAPGWRMPVAIFET